MTDPVLSAAALESRAWPFEEARKLVARIKKSKTPKTEILFETGYGPSGLPHIGTFGEVARTTMVRRAFETMTDIPTRLLCFSDDMDGMRKIPDNVPDRSFLEPHLQKPLTSVPNPLAASIESFGDHNNAMLRRFLDTFGFDYEFASATEYYKAGRFDAVLLRAAERYDDIMAVMLPTLGEERQATYCPFLPISPTTGPRALRADEGSRRQERHDHLRRRRRQRYDAAGHRRPREAAVEAGFRHALGRARRRFRDVRQGPPDQRGDLRPDLRNPRRPSAGALRLRAVPRREGPEDFEVQGQRPHHRRVADLCRHGVAFALHVERPREAKKLYFDVIPRAVDEYAQFQNAYGKQELKDRLMNPLWHIHGGNPPPPEEGSVSFSLLLNLVAVANTEDKSVLWAFLKRYAPQVSQATHPRLDSLVGYAIRYFTDFVKPNKKYRAATDEERKALEDLSAALAQLPEGSTPEAIQQKVYDIGRREPYTTTQKDGSVGVAQTWFNMLYQVLLGEERGPRFGSFAALYGVENTRALIGKALKGELVKN